MNPIDPLQIKIDEAMSNLSKETRAAIEDVDWKLIVLKMNDKYTPEQLENLEAETELLLCGISSPKVYQEELEKRMNLTKEGVVSLLNEMDRLIFKKIQEKLEERLSVKGGGSLINKIPAPIPPLSKTTERVITNNKTQSPNNEQVPRPPYISSSKQQVVSSKGEKELPKQPEVVPVPTQPKSFVIPKPMEEKVINNEELIIKNEKPVNIMEEKMKGATVSVNTVSDHSAPKIDPYREAF